MNLRDLQYLVSVAEQLSFRKAAEQCNVSQPTLSMQLKKLEEYLGAQLFERTNKKVTLTPIGKEILAHARTALYEAEQMRAIAKLAKDPLAGELRMGVFPTLAPYLLPSLVPLMTKALPNINLLLIEDKTQELIRQLEHSEIDCALIAMPEESNALESQALFVEPFMLAVPVHHALAKRKKIHIGDLDGMSLLLLDEGHCLREQALAVCHTVGGTENQHFRATSLETLRQMVAAGSAITLMPSLAARHEDPMVRYIPFHAPAPARTIGLFWRKSSARKVLFEKLVALMKDYPTS